MESEKLNQNEDNLKSQLPIKAYKKRWLIISIFICYATLNSAQWTEYSIISNLVVKYYNVSSTAVEWTSIVYMTLFPIFVLPVSYLIDKKGLRLAALMGGLGTALGIYIKAFSVSRNLFYIVLIGQTLESLSQLFIVSLPTKIASVWFKANEVSTACALCVIGSQLGMAFGFIFPPIIVRDHEHVDDIGWDLKYMCWGLAAIMTPISLAVIFCFSGQPPKPPNMAQAEERLSDKKVTIKSFHLSLKSLWTNTGFLLHSFAFGMNIGVMSVLGTFLNPFVLYYFENAQEDAGRMGLLMVICGIIGSFICGVILDRTHKYKEAALFMFALNAISLAAFMFALMFKSRILVYLAIAVEGFSSNAYYAIAYEVAAELTYPTEESTTSGILFSVSQLFGAIFSVLAGIQLKYTGVFWTLVVQTAYLVIGTIVTIFVPNQLRRQDALKGKSFLVPQKEHMIQK